MMNKRKNIIALLFIVVFLTTNFVIFENLHLHRLANGHLFVHGHPYDKKQGGCSPLASHQHKAGELLFYFALMAVEGIVLLFLAGVFMALFISYLARHSDVFRLYDLSRLPLSRAPPAIA